jgi:hypothetical protein
MLLIDLFTLVFSSPKAKELEKKYKEVEEKLKETEARLSWLSNQLAIYKQRNKKPKEKNDQYRIMWYSKGHKKP